MKNILFVDDEYEALAEVRRALEPQRLRWTVHCALDGQSALDLCRTLTFDLVIARQLMQGMDGVTLLKHLAATQPGAARLLVADSAELDLARAARAASLAHRLLTKPFQPAELVAAIERITCLQELFSTPALRATIGRIGGLPSLSHTFTTLSLEVRNPEATVSNVARIIENDIAMAAKVLQLVNSGFFGLSQRMTNLQTAVSYLGLDTIRNLALAAETFTLFKPDLCLPKAFLESLQRRANRAAAIAGALHLNIRERDTAVVGALLHNLGQLVLAHSMPHQCSAALRLAAERKIALHESEEALLGISHAELGAYLLGMWGIEQPVVEAVAHHHKPTRIPHHGFDASTAVFLAGLLSEELELHPRDTEGAELRAADRESLERLELMAQFGMFRERAARALDAR